MEELLDDEGDKREPSKLREEKTKPKRAGKETEEGIKSMKAMVIANASGCDNEVSVERE